MDTRPQQPSYEERHFIGDISLYFEQMRLPRMAGSILGVLLIADQPQQSIDDLCEALQASKSAICTNARLLCEMGLIERVPSPVPRRVCFRLVPGVWAAFVGMQMRLMASLHQIAKRGLELLKDDPPVLRERLQEAHDMFSLIEQELPAMLGRIEHGHGPIA